MDRFEIERRSNSRTSSVSGRSAHSERSWNSLTPQEQELADSLQTQQLRLESLAHKSSGSTSSSGSEARDRLREAEARERVIEFQQRDSAGPTSAHRDQSGSLSPRAAEYIREYADRCHQGHGHAKKKSNPRSNSASSARSGGSGSDIAGTGSSSGPGKSEGGHVTELQDKISALEVALKERDQQASQMMSDCYDIDEQNQTRLILLETELREALKARKTAEDERLVLEVKAAGDKARFVSSLEYEKSENVKFLEMHRSNELKASEARNELEEARQDLAKEKQRKDVEEDHQVKMKAVADNRIEALEALLKNANNQLAESRRQGSKCGTAREQDLQQQIDVLLEEKLQNRRDMSEVRLELLGLKKKHAMQVIDRPEPAPSPVTRRSGGRGRGRGRGRTWGKGTLDIIDEEEDGYEELPQLEDDSWASDCVSSDAGDFDQLTNPDNTAQNDLLSKLLLELSDERKSTQNLREDHASQSAEQTEQIAALQKQLAESGLEHEKAAAENARLRERGNQDKIKQLRIVDDLNLKVRDLEDTMHLQVTQMKEQTNKEQQEQFEKNVLQEKIQMQTESLRIASLRLQDALQQHQSEAMRQLQQVNSLKLALAMERKRNARSSTSTTEAGEDLGPEDVRPEDVLVQRVKELEEERNLLLSKIEVKDVQHQVQLEDTYRDHAQRLREQQMRFEEQIAEIRARYEQLLKMYPMVQGQDQASSTLQQEGRSSEGLRVFEDSRSTSTTGTSTGMRSEMLPQIQSDRVSSSIEAEASDTQRHGGIGGGSVCSTPVARSVVSTGGTGSGVESSTAENTRIRSMIWSILELIPNAAVMLCTFENLVIERVTARAGAIFSGLDLIGMSFFNLLRERSNAAILRRMMLVNQSMADSSQAEISAFAAKTLGRFEVLAMAGKAVDSVISMAHLPADSSHGAAGQDERRVILVLAEQTKTQPLRGEFSVASSDICPSDSVSVGRRRPQFVSSEVQRTQLRASFFSSMKSRLSSASSVPSSPRNSLVPE
ncbi:unnamed protein product [Symbiodinium pilosum]|uniref:Uncharacterized protein n=1 Tax=Symbiodinium pilosum TaxID=2952 RepID=A0A812KUB5_SYMPI|nr:unnamed protein product [Symbiodinium pilosum]